MQMEWNCSKLLADTLLDRNGGEGNLEETSGLAPAQKICSLSPSRGAHLSVSLVQVQR